MKATIVLPLAVAIPTNSVWPLVEELNAWGYHFEYFDRQNVMLEDVKEEHILDLLAVQLIIAERGSEVINFPTVMQQTIPQYETLIPLYVPGSQIRDPITGDAVNITWENWGDPRRTTDQDFEGDKVFELNQYNGKYLLGTVIDQLIADGTVGTIMAEKDRPIIPDT